MNYAALRWSFPEFVGQPPSGYAAARLLILTNDSDTSTLLSDVVRDVRIGSPLPSAGEGLEGEGDSGPLNQLPNPTVEPMSQDSCRNIQPCARPLAPLPGLVLSLKSGLWTQGVRAVVGRIGEP